MKVSFLAGRAAFVSSRFIVILCAIFPFGFSLVFNVFHFENVNYGVFICLSVLTVGLVLIATNSDSMSTSRLVLAASFVIVCGTLWRMFFMLILDPQPVSDFLGSFHAAKYDDFVSRFKYYSIAPYNAFYAITIQKVMILFGDGVPVIWMLNLVVNAVTGVGIVILSMVMVRSSVFALSSLLLYMFWPQLAVYSGVMTGEHLAMLFLVLFTLFWMLASVPKYDGWRKCVVVGGYSALAGLCAGMFNGYRPFFPVLMIALVMYELVVLARGCAGKKHDAVLWSLLEIGLKFAVFVIVVVGTWYGITRLIESKIGQFGGASVYGPAVRIYFGLNPESKGAYSAKVYKEIDDLIQLHGDEGAEALMLDRLGRLIMEHTDELASIIWSKAIRNWGYDLGGLWWATSYEKTYPEKYGSQIDLDRRARVGSGWHRIEGVFGVFSSCFYTMLLLLGVIGCVSVLFRLSDSNVRLVFVILVLLGFALLGLIVESQSRYKSVFAPYICLAAGYGCFQLGSLALITMKWFKEWRS
ncbi:MAG: hypothetical protein PHF70_00085 [Opitutales bacterium]|nr:hypothetical protein [Opitutales bacterium]